MGGLEYLLPTPRLLEIDTVDVAVRRERAWERIRHGDLGSSPIASMLFGLRTLPERIRGDHRSSPELRLDALVSTPRLPGFQLLFDHPPSELVVGAIGKVWHLAIPFVHVASCDDYRAFDRPGYVKVAWAVRFEPRGSEGTRVTLELRVDATDDASWKKFQRYFRLIGPASRFIRRSLLAGIARELGALEHEDERHSIAGDALLRDATAQMTEGVTIEAPPEAVWPWLLQMGCRRGGFYAIDALDNGGARSAREVHGDLQDVHVGDVLPATPEGADGFEVLAIDPRRTLVLGGLYDTRRRCQLPFHADRPDMFWHVTWSFQLDPLDERTTRLRVRGRAAFSRSERLHAAFVVPVHWLMQREQLQHLARRVEGKLPRDDWRDVAEGVFGAAVIAAAMLTPFLRAERSHWGIDAEGAAREFPGDDLVPHPRWGWTHAIEIAAPMEKVWPWIAQVGADRAGFYSYQWLENAAGCNLRNAESVHPEWSLGRGDRVVLHPKIPPLPVVDVVPGRYFVLRAGPSPTEARARPSTTDASWASASWLFYLEPLGADRCRMISRYRCDTSSDLAARLSFGPALMEPIGFAMDRRMLLGLKARCEHVAP